MHLEALGERLRSCPGTRWIERAEFDLFPRGGEKFTLEVEGESWKQADLQPGNPFHLHLHNLVRAHIGEKRGIGLLEQILIGPHQRYGFQGLADGAHA